MVLVGAYLSGMEGHFKISVITNRKVEFLPVWPPAWVLRTEKGEALDSIETSLTLSSSSSEQAKKRKKREEQAKSSWVNRLWAKAQSAVSTTADYDLEEDDDDLEKNDNDDDDD